MRPSVSPLGLFMAEAFKQSTYECRTMSSMVEVYAVCAGGRGWARDREPRAGHVLGSRNLLLSQSVCLPALMAFMVGLQL